METTKPTNPSFEQIGSPGTPGILLIACPFPLGNGYCIVEGVLYTCAVNADGSFELSEEKGEEGFNWGQVYDMSKEENRDLEPVIQALGGDYASVAANSSRPALAASTQKKPGPCRLVLTQILLRKRRPQVGAFLVVEGQVSRQAYPFHELA